MCAAKVKALQAGFEAYGEGVVEIVHVDVDVFQQVWRQDSSSYCLTISHLHVSGAKLEL